MKFRLVAIILSFRVTVMPPLEVETTQCFPGKKHTYSGGQTGYVLEKDPEDDDPKKCLTPLGTERSSVKAPGDVGISCVGPRVKLMTQ